MRERSFVWILFLFLTAPLGPGLEAAPGSDGSHGAIRPAPYLVRGQVVTAEGALAGAMVRLVHKPPWNANTWPEHRPRFELREPIETSSDEHGRFEIAVELGSLASHQASWRLEIASPGLARRILEVPPHDREPRPGTTEELGGVLLSPGVAVRGRVVDAGNAPLTGVRVSLWRSGGGSPWTATTDEAGGLRILDVPAGEYDILVDQAGYEPHRVDRRPIRDATDLGTMTLSPTRPLAGKVVDVEGKPIAGVRVRFRHDLPSTARDWLLVLATSTDSEGAFRLDEIPSEPGAPYQYRFEKEGYLWRMRQLEFLSEAGELRLAAPVTLAPSLFLAGEVVDPSGDPIADVEVMLLSGERGQGGVRSHPTGADGRFRIEQTKAGDSRLSLRARGFLATEVELEASPDPEPVQITLEPIATTDLLLAVRDAAGQPVSGAQIYFHNHSGQPRAYYDNGWTDDDGHRRLDRVPHGGPASLEIRHPEHPRWWRSDLMIEEGQRTLNVDLDPAPWKFVTVRGRVTDGASPVPDRPMAGAEIALSDRTRIPKYRARADGDGEFELRRVKEGAYQLIVTAPRRAPAELPVKVSAEMPALEVSLGTGTVLRGSITGATAERVDAQWRTEMRQAAVDGDGYRIDHLGAGRWSVTAAAGETYIRSEIQIEPGETEARLDLEFPAGHRVSGQLLIDGQPLPPVPASLGGKRYIRLESTPDAPASGHHHTEIDAGGNFAFERIAAGPYHLTYYDQTGRLQHPVQVDADVEVFLDLATGPLHGRLVDGETGVGVAGVTVRANPEIYVSHGPRWQAVSDSAGWFDLGRVLPGTWILMAKAPGFLQARQQITVDATSQPAVVELVASEGLRIRVETTSSLPHSVDLQLRDANGERVARGFVTLAGKTEGHWSEAPRGRYRLWASNKMSWISTDVEIPGPVVTLAFPPAGALRLRVPELELEAKVPWKPAAPVEVGAVLELPDDPAFDGQWRRRSTRLRLMSLTPGLWRFEVRVADGRVWTGTARVFDGRSSEVVLTLR